VKILIIRLSSLGDIILTQPVVKLLKIKYPTSKITYLTKEVFGPLLKTFPEVDEIITWENLKNTKDILRKCYFDLVVDLHKKISTKLACYHSNYKQCVTYDKKHFLRWQITKKITNKSIDSTLDLYFSALKKIGINEKYTYPMIKISQNCIDKAIKLLANYNINFAKYKIAVFPGATHPTKMYPINYLAKFISLIPKSWNCQFVVMGSYEEKELGLNLKRIIGNDIIEICGATDLELLPAVVSQMDGVISNDSGSMHVAAALGLPQMAIFGATHTRLGFRPLNEKAIIIQSNIKCQPCSLHGGKYCKKGNFECMTSIKPTYLLDRFKFMFEKYILNLD